MDERRQCTETIWNQTSDQYMFQTGAEREAMDSITVICAGYAAAVCCSIFILWGQKLSSFWKGRADLAINVDLTGHLKTLKKSLQGKDQLAPQLYWHNEAFYAKLHLIEKLFWTILHTSPHCSNLHCAFQKTNVSSKRRNMCLLTSLKIYLTQRYQDFFIIEKKKNLFSEESTSGSLTLPDFW